MKRHGDSSVVPKYVIIMKEACMKIFKIMLAIVVAFGVGTVTSAQEAGAADQTAGARIFTENCSRCHPNGGNIIVPGLPLAGSIIKKKS